jgi:hypothetical protein
MLMEILQICVARRFANFAIRGTELSLPPEESAFPSGSSHGKAFYV